MCVVMKEKYWLVAGCMALLMCSMMPNVAYSDVLQVNELTKLEVNQQGITKRTYTLEALGAEKDIRIRGVDGRRKINFSVRNDEVLRHAELNLKYSYSPGLLDKISQINVILNGYTVASYAVGKKFPQRGTLKVALNPYMISEYNTLTFQLIGHYTITECEYPNHTTLWAVVSKLSTLTLETQKVIFKPGLEHLPAPFFDRHDNNPLILPMVFAGDVSFQSVKAAGIVASWFGRYADYRGAKFPTFFSKLPKHGNAVVFIAGKGNLKSIGGADIQGSTIAVRSNPNDPFGHLLLIEGRNDAELLKAATALVLGKVTLSGQSSRILDFETAPQREPYDAPAWLPSDRKVSFGELARTDNLEVRGGNPDTIRVRFHYPPDLFAWRDTGADVMLKYRYSAPLDVGKARLDINFNEHFVKSLALQKASVDKSASDWWENVSEGWLGAEDYSDKKIKLPSAWFGFYNTMQFQYYLENGVGKCEEDPRRYFRGSISPDSTIDISKIPHYKKMPNIGLFSKLGYPFTRMADLSETAVIFSDRISKDSIDAFLRLMGMMGASTGYPAVRVAVDNGSDVGKYADRDILFIGSLDSSNLFKYLGDSMPLKMTDGHLALNNTSMVNLSDKLFLNHKVEDDVKKGGRVLAESAGSIGLITSFESPWQSGRTVVVVASSGDERVSSVADSIVGDANLDAVNADTAFLSYAHQKVVSVHDADGKNIINQSPYVKNVVVREVRPQISLYHFSDSYYVGHLPFFKWLFWWFSSSSWALFLVVLVAVILAAVVIYTLMRVMEKRRLSKTKK